MKELLLLFFIFLMRKVYMSEMEASVVLLLDVSPGGPGWVSSLPCGESASTSPWAYGGWAGLRKHPIILGSQTKLKPKIMWCVFEFSLCGVHFL